MSIVELARTSGKIPPSLLQKVSDDSKFEAAVAAIQDPNGTHTRIDLLLWHRNPDRNVLRALSFFDFAALVLSSQAKVSDFDSLMQVG